MYDIEMFLKSKGCWKMVEYKSYDDYVINTIGATIVKIETELASEAKDEVVDLLASASTNVKPVKPSMIANKKRVIEIVGDESKYFNKLEEWNDGDVRALSIIGLNVGNRFQKFIRIATTAHQLWQLLLNEFGSYNCNNLLDLKCKFYEAKMSEKESLLNYVDRINDIIEKLEAIGCVTDDSEVCYKVLSSLPEKYKPLKLTCLMIPRDQLNISRLRQQFSLDSSSSSNEKSKKSNQEEALSLAQKDIVCFKCGGKGHKSFECRSSQSKIDKYQEKKKEKEKEKEGSNSSRNNNNNNNNSKNEKKKNSGYNNNKKKEKACNVEDEEALGLFDDEEDNISEWYFDSGCTVHITNDKSMLSDLVPTDVRLTGAIAKDSKRVNEKGDCHLLCEGEEDDSIVKLRIEDVLYSADARKNLLSVKKICQNGNYIIFDDKQARIYKKSDDRLILSAEVTDNGLYGFKAVSNDVSKPIPQEEHVWNLESKATWHERLGHLSVKQLEKLAQVSNGIAIKDVGEEKEFKCEVCDLAKMTRKNFDRSEKVLSKNLGDIIHSDVCGPVRPMSKGRARYIVTFTDDASRFSWIYTMKKKNEVYGKFVELHALLKNQNIPIRHLKSDRGGEYIKGTFKEYLKENGIKQILNPPHTPQRTGVAERLNRTIFEKVRSMLKSKKVAKCHWPYAVLTANYLKNRSITSVLKKTPYEAFYGKKPELKNLRIFGSKVFYKINTKLQKLDDRSREGIFIGYDEDGYTYRILDKEKGTIIYSRDVKFYEVEPIIQVDEESEEEESTLDEEDEDESEEEETDEEEDDDDDDDDSQEEESEDEVIQKKNEDTDFPVGGKIKPAAINDPVVIDADVIDDPDDHTQINSDQVNSDFIDPDRINSTADVEKSIDDKEFNDCKIIIEPVSERESKREKRFPDTFRGYYSEQQLHNLVDEIDKDDSTYKYEQVNVLEEDNQEPDTYQEALDSDNREEWLKAIADEMESHKEMGTWQIVDKPKDRKVIGNRFVFKLKINANGQIDKYKARLVAKGYSQKKGIDYDETFSPVVRIETLRYLISFALKKEWKIKHMDVVTAFLNGDLEEEVFMELPENVRNQFPGKVALLKKSIYGLKQASRCWNQRFHNFVLNLGFKQSDADPCVYIKKDANGEICAIISLYVDDNFIFGEDDIISEIEKYLSHEFKMKDLGELSSFLGIRVIRTKEEITLDQEYYTEKLLVKYNMNEAKAVATPCEERTKGLDVSKLLATNNLYRSAVGSLIYLSKCTRPDIAYAVSKVSMHFEKPTEENWTAVKRIFRYLKGTITSKLCYTKRSADGLYGYADASYAEDNGTEKKRRSVGAYIFMLNGAAISWCSKRQRITALSSMEAELIALTEAAKEGIWLRKLEADLGIIDKKLLIYEDNQATIKTSDKRIHTERSKHIDVRHYFIREKVEAGEVEVKYCSTTNMIADALTKGLARVLHQRHTAGLGIKF
jgi:hypothetical protein